MPTDGRTSDIDDIRTRGTCALRTRTEERESRSWRGIDRSASARALRKEEGGKGNRSGRVEVMERRRSGRGRSTESCTWLLYLCTHLDLRCIVHCESFGNLVWCTSRFSRLQREEPSQPQNQTRHVRTLPRTYLVEISDLRPSCQWRRGWNCAKSQCWIYDHRVAPPLLCVASKEAR